MTAVVLDASAAERRAERIRLRLDAIADNYSAVLPMIREAIEKRDDIALGYRSPGEYVADRFGGALNNLGIEVRREVVRELTSAGMSTRAIAPVVGVSKSQVAQDQVSSAGHPTPAGVDPRTGEVPADYPEPVGVAAALPVTGIDGKTYNYTRPEARPTPRRALPDQFFDAAFDLAKAVERVHRLTEDDRFPQNAEKVAAKHRNDLLRLSDLLHEVTTRLA